MSASGKKSNESSVLDRLYKLIKDMSEDEQLTLLKELEERLFKDKREHKRKPFFMVVDYSTDDRAYKDYIQNISTGGVFIETRMPLSVGQVVSLSFPLRDYQKCIKITGEVVRVSPQGIGVKFRMVDQDQEAMIKSLLESM
ncbi:MAG: PilZ domain-containing protein [Desulfatiglandales bacterium]